MKTLKSVGAIVAGFFVGGALSVGTDALLETLKIFPPLNEGFFVPWMIVLAIVYRSTYNVLGCYIAATLAPEKPMLHVMIIGVVGLCLTIVGTITHADKGPLWYGITLAVLTIPCAWLGAKLQMRSHKALPVAGI